MFRSIPFLDKLLARWRRQPPKPAPRVALVLGGGAARGFAHVGVIRVLEEARIPVHLIVGTSVGSLIGAIYAARPDVAELERIALQLNRDDLVDYSLLSFRKGLIAGARLERFVLQNVPVALIEDLRIAYAAVATDIRAGVRVILDHGPLARAVRASCALPGLFQPVELNGKLLVDGGVLEALPVPTARALGADLTIAVDVGSRARDIQATDFVTIATQAINISGAQTRQHHAQDADVLIEPAVSEVGMFDFGRKEYCIQAGAAAARAALPRIRAAFASRGQTLPDNVSHPSPPTPGAAPWTTLPHSLSSSSRSTTSSFGSGSTGRA